MKLIFFTWVLSWCLPSLFVRWFFFSTELVQLKPSLFFFFGKKKNWSCWLLELGSKKTYFGFQKKVRKKKTEKTNFFLNGDHTFFFAVGGGEGNQVPKKHFFLQKAVVRRKFKSCVFDSPSFFLDLWVAYGGIGEEKLMIYAIAPQRILVQEKNRVCFSQCLG